MESFKTRCRAGPGIRLSSKVRFRSAYYLKTGIGLPSPVPDRKEARQDIFEYIELTIYGQCFMQPQLQPSLEAKVARVGTFGAGLPEFGTIRKHRAVSDGCLIFSKPTQNGENPTIPYWGKAFL